jgi:hypothetical protein
MTDEQKETIETLLEEEDVSRSVADRAVASIIDEKIRQHQERRQRRKQVNALARRLLIALFSLGCVIILASSVEYNAVAGWEYVPKPDFIGTVFGALSVQTGVVLWAMFRFYYEQDTSGGAVTDAFRSVRDLMQGS